MNRARITLQKAREVLRTVSWLSLDVFDTALFRKVTHPTDVFLFMESEAQVVIGGEVRDFASSRIAAERNCRADLKRNRIGLQDVTLEQIYAQLGKSLHLSDLQRKRLLNLEFKMELALTYANPLVLDFYKESRRLGKKIIFLSDTYLSSEQVKILLQTHGYTEPIVYTSSELGSSKGTGRLYQKIRDKLRISRWNILHIGDKYRADYLRAKLNDWKSLRLQRFRIKERDNSALTSLSRGLIEQYHLQHPENNPDTHEVFHKIGYSVVGPVYFYFVQWLCHQVAQDGIKRLLLCSRDGFPLLRCFEILREKWKIQLETRYFFASRRLFNLATIRKIQPSDVDFLLMPNPGLRLRDFVERLGLDSHAQAPALMRLGFNSLDQQLVHSGFGRFIDSAYRPRLEKWLELCGEELLMQAEEEHKLVLEYLREMQSGRTDTAIVDVGWKATVCTSMSRLMHEIDSGVHPRTYFFGTYECARQLLEAGARLNSFLFHLGEPSALMKIVAGHEGIVEMLFHAPHGSLCGLKRGFSGIEPVYGECEYDKTTLSYLESMTAGAHHFVEDMVELVPPGNAFKPAPDEVGNILARLTRCPTRTEAENLGGISYRASYGDRGAVQPLAQTTRSVPYSLRADLLAYEKASWKEGYLVQVSRGRRLTLVIATFVHSVFIAMTSKTLLASIRWAIFKR